MSTQLLSGITILENASVITGPFAGMLLADLGAEVIKIEPTQQGGDAFRTWREVDAPISPSFAAYNRGKRSIAINLRHERGRQLYLALAKRADAIIENYRPEAMDNLGAGWDALRKVNPRLVYCDISGMGNTGPEKRRPTYDAVAQAVSGLWSQLSDISRPEPVGPPLADQITALYAACAVLAGLQHSSRTGEGAKVEVSMLASCLAFQASAIATYLAEGIVPDRTSRARNSQSYAFSCRDGVSLAIHLSSGPKFWEALCHAVEREDLLQDPRFSGKKERAEHYAELREELEREFQLQTRAWWLTRLESYDVPVAPILNLKEALGQPQVAAIGMLGDEEHNDFRMPRLRSAIAVAGVPNSSPEPAPERGQHTETILLGLGLSRTIISELREQGAIN